MIARFAAVVALVAACLVGSAAPTTAAVTSAAGACSPSGYAPGVATQTSVTVRAGDAGRATVSVAVHANDANRVTGRVALSGAVHRTFSYNGSAVSTAIPVQSGRTYTVRAAFTPSDANVHGCSADQTTYTTGTTDPGANPGATLPNTGGPHALWLILGLLLVAAGGSAVVVARRRPAL